MGLLDFMTSHHEALAQLLGETSPAAPDVLVLAARFVTQALAPFEMVQRVAEDSARTAHMQARHAEIIRRLSFLLGDTSLASGDQDSFHEMLSLVAEQARELSHADRCSIEVGAFGMRLRASDPQTDQVQLSAGTTQHEASAPLDALNGDQLGVLMAWREGTAFRDEELAVLEHLAQMVAAAVDRHVQHSR
jgi:hypothetical protein